MHKRASHTGHVTKEAGELTDLFKKTDDEGMAKKDESGCGKTAELGMRPGVDLGETKQASVTSEKATGERPVY